MAINLQGNGANLQGGGINLQGNSMPLQGSSLSSPAAGSSITPSATAPGTPKQAYIQKQVQQTTPTNLATDAYNSQYGLGFGNGSSFNSQGTQQSPAQSSQPSSPITSPGVYNPYTTPAYQQYIQNAVTAATPALTNPQIQQGLVSANTGLQGLETIASNNIQSDINNPALSQSALTGQEAGEAQVLANKSVPYQTQINLLNAQQAQGEKAAGIPLTAANTSAGFQAGLETPQSVSTGNQLVQFNPSTGQTTQLANQPSFGLGQGIAGQPVTFNQNTGAIGGQGLGTTPPTLGGQTGQQSALQTVAQTYGLTDPASQLALKSAVDQTLASNGDVNAAGVPANLQPAVKAVLSQMSGGAYSPGNAAINQKNVSDQSQSLNAIQPIAKATTANLSALQDLADKVKYSNSPISNDIRNQVSGTLLTDPNIATLGSALGFVTSEVSQVLGGGSATVAALNEASSSLQANKLSPEVLKSVIANAQLMIDNRLKELGNPANAASLPTGLSMPSGYSASTPPAGTFTLK